MNQLGQFSPPLAQLSMDDGLEAGAVRRVAHRWAIVASLIEIAKLYGVEPFAWLRDVLARMVAGHPSHQLDQLLPWSCAATG